MLLVINWNFSYLDGLLSFLICLVARDASCCKSSHLVVYFSAYHASLSSIGKYPILWVIMKIILLHYCNDLLMLFRGSAKLLTI